MKKITNKRLSKAAKRYLKARGYAVLDEFECCGEPYIAADDCGEVVIARVGCGFGRIPEPWCDRDAFEEVAAFYLRTHDEIDVPVRADSIDMLILSEGRALLRHTVNCSNGFCEA